jgi:hypothetical protein
VDPAQSVPVAADLLLVAVAQERLRRDQHIFDAPALDGHPLDPIRRDRALDDGVLTQHFQLLGGLPRVEFLLAPKFTESVEVPGRARRHGQLRISK